MSSRYPVIFASVLASMAFSSGCQCRVNPDSVEDSTVDSADEPLPDEMWISPLPPGFANQLMVSRVVLDPDRSRAYTVAHMIGTVGEIDMETHELLAMHDLTAIFGPEPDGLEIAVDIDGVLFISSNSAPALTRFDPQSGEAEVLDVEMAACGTALPRDEGGVIAACRVGTDIASLLVLDAEGQVLYTEPLAAGVVDMTITQDQQHIACYMPRTDDGGRIEVRDEATLELVHSCAAPEGGTKILELERGGFALMGTEEIHLVPCSSEPPVSVSYGYENRDMLELDDGLLVADRVDVEELAGAIWSRGRVLGIPGLQLERSFYTGKNCVSLALDEETGQVWLQSEDTGEIWVLDPSDGTILDKIPVGRHAESLVPGSPGELYFSGRLSTEVSHVDLVGGVITPFSGTPIWPVSPRLVGDELWVVDSPTTSVHALDTTTLSLTQSHDPDVGEESVEYFKGELFSGLGWHEGRGTLFVGYTRANTLHEVDPVGGEVLAEWALSGQEPEFDQNGIIEVHVTDTAIYTLRTTRGNLTKIRLESHLGGEDDVTFSAAVELSEAQYATMAKATLFGQGLMDEESGLFYIGGFAFDMEDLSEVPERERAITQMLGKLHQDAWIAWDSDASKVVVLDDAGEVYWDRDIDQGEIGRPGFALAENWGPHLIYSSMESSEIRAFSLAELME